MAENAKAQNAFLRAVSSSPPSSDHLDVVWLRQVDEDGLAKCPREKLGSVEVLDSPPTLERMADERDRREASVGRSSSPDVFPSSHEVPAADRGSDTEVINEIENNRNSANISLVEMVETSAVFVEDALSLGAKFLKTLERDKNVKVAKKGEYGELVQPLLNYVTKQHSWLCLLHGKASLKGDTTDRREIGVGMTPRFTRNFPRFSFTRTEGVPNLGIDVGTQTSILEPESRSKSPQTPKKGPGGSGGGGCFPFCRADEG